MKQYDKTVWKDRIVQCPNRYKDQNNNILILTQDPGEVAQDGTLVEAKLMNNMENGIDFLYKNLLFYYDKVLLLDNWIKNEITGFYEYDITDNNITCNTLVNGNLDLINQVKLNNACISSYDGGFKVITDELPNENINITFKYSLANATGEEIQ